MYPFIDFIYELWGIENLGIREHDLWVHISLKAGEVPFTELPFPIEQLLLHVQEGTIEIAEGLVIVRSAYRKTNLELPIKILDKVKQFAENEKITMSQWVERALQQSIDEEE